MNIIFLSHDFNNSMNEKIISLIEEQGQKVFNGTTPDDMTQAKLLKHSNTLIKEMKKTDCLVVEASQPSFDLGRNITLAIQQHKPILLLYKNALSKEFVFGSSRLINSSQYIENETNVDKILSDFFKKVKKQRLHYRFNLMISRDINSYLMDKARFSGISKADYIRQLISEDMNTTENE